MLEPYLVIGEISKPQGVKGEVKVRPITSDPMRFAELKSVFFEENGAYIERAVKTTRVEFDAAYLMIEGVKDRDAAEKLRGRLLYVDRARAIPLPEDAEFICDLVGCEGTDDEGNVLGTLTDVMQPSGGDVYVFKGDQGEVLVPALKSVILKVDVHNKKMLLSAKRLAEVAVFEEPKTR